MQPSPVASVDVSLPCVLRSHCVGDMANYAKPLREQSYLWVRDPVQRRQLCA